jgi:hypothetical protein
VAALAVDLGLQLGTDLGPPRRKPGEPVRVLPSTHADASIPNAGPTTAALVPQDIDDLIAYTPTSLQYRAAMREAGWRAVVLAGPATAVPTVMQGLQLWPFKVLTTGSPRDRKHIMQQENWHEIDLHAVLWCQNRKQAESLKTMLIDALDFRHHHLAFRFFSLEPAKAKTLALEVARTAGIPVFEEAQRLEWLDRAVRLTAEERTNWLQETVAKAIKQIGRR